MNWQEAILARLPEVANVNDWLPYLSSIAGITGVIGIIAGIIGMITGMAGYIRSGRMKALDLRLQLHKAEDAVRDMLNELPALIALADTLHSAIYVADAKMLWNQSCAADRSEVASMQAQLPAEGSDYRRLSNRSLEDRLVAMNRLRVSGTRIREKYLSALAGIEKKRQEMRELSSVFAQSIKRGT